MSNPKVGDYAYKGNLAYEFISEFQWAFDNKINMHFINAKYDGECSIAGTKKWMSEVKDLDMENTKEEKTEVGTIKRPTPNFTYEIYEDAGHMFGLYDPKYAVGIIKNLVKCIGENLNEEKESKTSTHTLACKNERCRHMCGLAVRT